MSTEEKIKEQIDKLLQFKYGATKTKASDIIAWANNILSIFKLILVKNDSRIQSLDIALNKYLTGGHIYHGTESGQLYGIFLGFLTALASDYKGGFLTDLRLEIWSEVECDFLSQADRLLKEQFKDPAAMIIGAVLEDSLKQLCKKYSVPEGSSIESMNAPLKQAGAYTLTVQKQVTGWADIRNNADHARFNQYELPQVKLMYQGVTDFIAKYLT
jgi:hypothetical protein